MLPPLIVPFLVTVAFSAAAVIVLAFLFAVLSPWLRRHLSALLRGLNTHNRP